MNDYKERNEEIRRLKKEGTTYRQLADIYGLSVHRIETIVKTSDKDTLGISPETYGPIRRAMYIQHGLKNFTLKDLEHAIEEGLPVRHIGEKRCKELSDILGREVVFTREYDSEFIRGALFVSSMYMVILRFKKEAYNG